MLWEQAIFFWTLLVRQIARFYHANPILRAQQLPAALALHDCHNKGKANDSNELELSPQETQQIKEIFDLFDTNGGGSIDQKELGAALYALGFQSEIASTTKFDLPNNSATLADFIMIMKGQKSNSCQHEDLWLSFSILSRQGRPGNIREEMPVIKLDSLKHVCHEFEVRLTADELVYMMNEADYDNSGSVDIHSFMRILRRTPWFWTLKSDLLLFCHVRALLAGWNQDSCPRGYAGVPNVHTRL
jgi:Ca2+-binding EF-hand superfamily protein